jgi:alpha-ketoglutarate-dependent taurine dioxygenase
VEAPRPATPLARWLINEWHSAAGLCDRHGAVLFRGFAVGGLDAFRAVIASSGLEPLHYEEPSTPRTEVEGRIYTSTEYPDDQRIELHNEMSYRRSWPEHLWFWCATPAERGGCTTLANFRRVYQRVSPGIRDLFAARGVMYERRFNTGFDLPWQRVFGTHQRERVAERLREEGVEFSWLEGDRLRTRTVVEGVLPHPRSAEMSWFNQAHLFHVSSLDADIRAALEAALGPDGVPRSARFGDGEDIDESILAEIREAIRNETTVVPWAAGDVLLIDNLSTAHGREPFAGARKVLVAMTGIMHSEYRERGRGARA